MKFEIEDGMRDRMCKLLETALYLLSLLFFITKKRLKLAGAVLSLTGKRKQHNMN
jgi:hypothetical protein